MAEYSWDSILPEYNKALDTYQGDKSFSNYKTLRDIYTNKIQQSYNQFIDSSYLRDAEGNLVDPGGSGFVTPEALPVELPKFNQYSTLEEAIRSARPEQRTGDYTITPVFSGRDYEYAITPRAPVGRAHHEAWDAYNQQWVPRRGESTFDKNMSSFTETFVPMFLGWATGGAVSGAIGGTGGAVAGGATGGATQALAAGAEGSDIGKAALTGAVTSGVTQGVGKDPYGYGTSNLGQAGTAATTTGLLSAAQGQTLEQQLRNAAIAGGGSYAGSTARDMYTDSTGGGPVEADRMKAATSLGNLTSMGTNLGLRTLWEDPSKLEPDYQSIINQYNAASNQANNTQDLFNPEALQELQNTPQGQQLLFLFEQEQATSGKKPITGGSGQYASGGDQTKLSEGWGELYAS